MWAGDGDLRGRGFTLESFCRGSLCGFGGGFAPDCAVEGFTFRAATEA